MAISNTDPSPSPPPKPAALPLEVESVQCDSCGFTEDCTPPYISRVRDRFQGRWLCGLCIEAVKDEVLRSQKLISTEEALNRHINFCNKFRSSIPGDQTEHPIFVMGRLIRRSLDSPRAALRSSSNNALPGVEPVHGRGLVRSESCFPSLSGR